MRGQIPLLVEVNKAGDILKALEWLEKRAKPSREMLYWFRPGNPSVWADNRGKFELEISIRMRWPTSK